MRHVKRPIWTCLAFMSNLDMLEGRPKQRHEDWKATESFWQRLASSLISGASGCRHGTYQHGLEPAAAACKGLKLDLSAATVPCFEEPWSQLEDNSRAFQP